MLLFPMPFYPACTRPLTSTRVPRRPQHPETFITTPRVGQTPSASADTRVLDILAAHVSQSHPNEGDHQWNSSTTSNAFRHDQHRLPRVSTATTSSQTPRPRPQVAINLVKLLLHRCFAAEIGDTQRRLRDLRKDTSGRSRKTPFGGVVDVHLNYLV